MGGRCSQSPFPAYPSLQTLGLGWRPLEGAPRPPVSHCSDVPALWIRLTRSHRASCWVSSRCLMSGEGSRTQLAGSWGVAGERGWKGTLEGKETGDSWLGGLQKRQKRKCREQENFVRFHKVKKGMTTGRASYRAFLKKQISQLHQSHFHFGKHRPG